MDFRTVSQLADSLMARENSAANYALKSEFR